VGAFQGGHFVSWAWRAISHKSGRQSQFLCPRLPIQRPALRGGRVPRHGTDDLIVWNSGVWYRGSLTSRPVPAPNSKRRSSAAALGGCRNRKERRRESFPSMGLFPGSERESVSPPGFIGFPRFGADGLTRLHNPGSESSPVAASDRPLRAGILMPAIPGRSKSSSLRQLAVSPNSRSEPKKPLSGLRSYAYLLFSR
jgi:hypothetical protein